MSAWRRWVPARLFTVSAAAVDTSATPSTSMAYRASPATTGARGKRAPRLLPSFRRSSWCFTLKRTGRDGASLLAASCERSPAHEAAAPRPGLAIGSDVLDRASTTRRRIIARPYQR
jgi:hypothetical protein